MNGGLAKGREVFKVETLELLEELESVILILEDNSNDDELIGRAFRAMHTIKGSASMFGADDIAEFTHDIETTFDQVREGKIKVSRELIDLTLAACDQIQIMVKEIDFDNSTIDKTKLDKILSGFRQFSDNETENKIDTSSETNPEPEVNEETESTFLIEFIPKPNIFAFGNDPKLLLDELKELGESKIRCFYNKLPTLEKMEPELSYLFWKIVLRTNGDINTIKDVFIFVEDDCELKIEIFDDGKNITKELDLNNLAEIYFENGKVVERDHPKIYKKILSTESEKKSTVSSLKNKSKNNASNYLGGSENKNQNPAHLVSNIRVASNKLDALVNFVGELVIAQARLSQYSNQNKVPELQLISEDIERLTNDIRDTSMDMRLVPIGTLFNKFKRLTRDLSREQNKVIDLIITGSETELDKTVIEKLNDPLIHIIRNSIDHGIETPDERKNNNKNINGKLELKAFQSGADVVIQIKDDGAGIDPEIILKKAIDKGLIANTVGMSEEDVLKLIFLPGFSTNETVTNLSGRGVGMDVVNKNIAALRGTVEIESEKGIGTTITMRLPLTLGIINGLLVKIANDHYVFPLHIVEECMEIMNQNGKRIIERRGKALPYIRLREHFGIDGVIPKIEHVIVIKEKENEVGFAVDEVVGEQQIVIKSLGKMYKNVEGLSGATILGNGNLALILDTQKIVKNVVTEEERRLNAVK